MHVSCAWATAAVVFYIAVLTPRICKRGQNSERGAPRERCAQTSPQLTPSSAVDQTHPRMGSRLSLPALVGAPTCYEAFPAPHLRFQSSLGASADAPCRYCMELAIACTRPVLDRCASGHLRQSRESTPPSAIDKDSSPACMVARRNMSSGPFPRGLLSRAAIRLMTPSATKGATDNLEANFRSILQ